MTSLQNLKGQLRDLLFARPYYKDGAALVPVLDYTELKRELRPLERGLERGAAGEPPIGQADKDVVELEITEAFQEAVNKTGRDVAQAVQTYEQRINGLDIDAYLNDMRDTCRASMADFNATVHAAFESLRNQKEQVAEKQNDLTHFREIHKLVRSASYPEGALKVLLWSIVAGMFLVETVANAVFLSAGNEGGLLGAYAEALAISMINIVSASLMGLFVVRYLNHHRRVYVAIALLAVVLFLMSIGLFNLGVAHYRDMAATDFFGESGVLAMQRLAESPFSLAEIQSWFMFGVGCLFAIIAMIDSYHLDDAYPGYGKVSRAVHEQRKVYDFEKRGVIDALTGLRAEAEGEITAIREELGEVKGHVTSLFLMRAALIDEFRLFREASGRQYTKMLEEYRQANRSMRTRAPRSFNAKATLSAPDIALLEFDVKEGGVSAAISEAKSLLDEVHTAFYQRFDDAVAKMSMLDDALPMSSGEVHQGHPLHEGGPSAVEPIERPGS